MSRRTQDPLWRKRSFSYRAVTFFGLPFQTVHLLRFLITPLLSVLQPQEASLLVWAVSVSLAATQEIAFAFSSSGYLDVSVPRVCLSTSYVFRCQYHPITDGGFPHSEISGSKLTYSSPKPIAVRRVLHRLLVPRHSPCALSNLSFFASDQRRISSSTYVILTRSRTLVRSLIRKRVSSISLLLFAKIKKYIKRYALNS